MSRVLFDATRKINRNPARPFGGGLLAYAPAYRSPATAEDRELYLEMLARDEADRRAAMEQAARDFDLHVEERYEHSMQLDRACHGPIC